MKRLLVTGGNGQLGSELKELAPGYPFEFLFIDEKDVDLADHLAIADFFKKNSFNYIINCAAYTAVDKAEDDRETCKRVNADAVAVLASKAKEQNAGFVQISTDYVFDGTQREPITEEDVPAPLSVYGKTKLEGENNLKRILPKAYIIRTSWLYSTYGKNFVKTIASLAKQRPELTVVSDQLGSPTYAGDLAHAIMTIVMSGVESGGIYNFSNEGAISWYDFAVYINDYFGFDCTIRPIKSSEYKTAAIRPKYSVLDKTKIRKAFNIDIPLWSDSLKECLNKMKV